MFLHILTIIYFLQHLNKNAAEDILEIGMTYEDRKTALYEHNEKRRLIANGSVEGQPKACDMLEMSYDMNLEKEAKKIAATCIFAHVKVTDGRWFAIGQNLYTSTSTLNEPNPNWPRAVQKWFDENKLYTYPTLSSGTGHYTQVVWSTSTCVGCSYAQCQDTREALGYRKLYVCNYGPAGNILGHAPYSTGCETGCDDLCPAENNQCSGASQEPDFFHPEAEFDRNEY